MNDFVPFSERHGLSLPDAPITIRAEAPDWLRRQLFWIASEVGLKPSKLREIICGVLIEAPNPMNWGDGREAEEEVRALLDGAELYQVYEVIENVAKLLCARYPEDQSKTFIDRLNATFRRKGVGWQLVDGRLVVRGEEPFEVPVRSALNVLEETGRPRAQQELHEALRDLSRRPEPDLTGALHHAMAALECVARDLTGEPNLTLGDWLKRHPTAFPQPLGSALEKRRGYTSQYGRHVEEGKPANYDEAELVVSLAGALSVYLLRKHE